MGEFLNEYVKDLQMLIPLSIGAALFLVIFSILYNHWVSVLAERKNGYTAIMVAIGNFMTLMIVAVFSWKAAFVCLLAFVASGTVMIIGDIYRSVLHKEAVIEQAKKTPRRKPLPYVPARLMNDAIDELTVAERLAEQAVEKKSIENIALILSRISKALRFLIEAKSSEGD